MSYPNHPLVHLLPQDLARGAQRYAQSLREGLDPLPQVLVTLFQGDGGVVRADLPLDVPNGRLRRLGLDPRAVLRLRRAIQRLHPSLVAAHGGEALKYAVLAGIDSSRLIYLRIGISSRKLEGRLRRRLYAWLLTKPERIVGVSDATAEELASEFGVAGERITVIPNARDASLYHPPEGRPEAPPILVFVGHMTTTKRPELFLELVARLREEGESFEALMVGDGPLLPDITTEGTRLGVEVLGRRQDVPELLRQGHVFVFTSRSESEGMPGVLIEAAMSGLPIVTTDVPGARDVVADGITGFVVGEHDTDQLVECTRVLLRDAGLRAEMGTAARERAIQRFSEKANVELWRTLIGEITGEASDPKRPGN